MHIFKRTLFWYLLLTAVGLAALSIRPDVWLLRVVTLAVLPLSAVMAQQVVAIRLYRLRISLVRAFLLSFSIPVLVTAMIAGYLTFWPLVTFGPMDVVPIAKIIIVACPIGTGMVFLKLSLG